MKLLYEVLALFLLSIALTVILAAVVAAVPAVLADAVPILPKAAKGAAQALSRKVKMSSTPNSRAGSEE
jgi:hypothetical protein